MIQTRKDLEQACNILSKVDIVAFDTEFIRETTFFPQLELIQLGTREQVWIVDVQAFLQGNRQQDLDPLIAIFTDPKILKTVHAAQGDQECLLTSLDCLPFPLFDTALGAALCGMGENLGLAPLLQKRLQVTIKKGNARTDWSKRPLPKQLEEYAAQDVEYLVRLTDHLKSELDERGRWEWALELSSYYTKYENFETPPDEMARRLAVGGKLDPSKFPVLFALMHWREARVRDMNIPRRRLADDGTLLDLARVCPQDEAHLASFRGLNRREVHVHGKDIIGIIADAREKESSFRLPRRDESHRVTQDEQQAISLLKAYVGILAAHVEVASKYLVPPDSYLHLVRVEAKSVEDLNQVSGLNPRAIELVGKHLLGFLNGQETLGLKNGKIKVVEVSK